MTTYVALLRAVNVGGTGKLPMAQLREMCLDAGFTQIQTYIASGNVVFASNATEAKVKHELEKRMQAYAEKKVSVFVRTASEIADVFAANPFTDVAPSKVAAVFLDEAPPVDALANAVGLKDEELSLGTREIYICYPSGMGTSKLRIPAVDLGTARNMRTVKKLNEIAEMRG